MNISMLLDLVAEIAPDHRAVQDINCSLSLAELRNSAQALAAEFQSLENQGPVAFVDINTTAFPICLFAAAYAGRTFVPLNYRCDEKLAAHYLAVLRPAVVIAGTRYLPLFQGKAYCRESVRLPRGATGEFSPIETSPDAPAVRIFTSGTTSAPKAATLYHKNLLAYILNSTAPMMDEEGATLVSTPNYHIATVSNLLNSIYSGRRIVFLDHFTPESWLMAANREQVTHAFVVPTMLQRIVEAIEKGGERPKHLRSLAYGGSPAARSTVERALKSFDPSTGFVNAYGLTETSSTISVLGPEDHRSALTSADPSVQARLMSAGKLLPGIEVRISDDGEILLRGPQVSGSYSEATGASDDWFHTGDLGSIDQDGYLFIQGRIDDMIIRGGENISPTEIEDVIKECAEVADAAVVGVSDPEWGQRVVAAVELRIPIDVQVLLERVARSLPSFKLPERIVVMELPRTDLGKLQRRKVRALLENNVQ